MRRIITDGITFVKAKSKSKYCAKLAKELGKEFKVKVTFLRKLSKAPYSIAFVLKGHDNEVFMRYNLDEAEFNYAIFHEIRHIQQERSKMYMLYYRPKRPSDVIRYLMDCITCEIDADLFSIKECASRQLQRGNAGYLRYSKATWKKFVMIYAKSYCTEFKITHKQIDAIVSLVLDEMKIRK